MKATLLFVLLLIPMLAFAHNGALDDYDYIVVVGVSAPASDVVVAANFAASMKATTGTTYKSSLDSDLMSDLVEEELAEKTIVVIDGKAKQVRILGNGDEAAESYFRNLGYDVRTNKEPSLSEVKVTGAAKAAVRVETKTDVKPIVIVKTPEETPAPAIIETEIVAEDDEEPQIVVEESTPTTPSQEEKSGVWARIAAWFASIF